MRPHGQPATASGPRQIRQGARVSDVPTASAVVAARLSSSPAAESAAAQLWLANCLASVLRGLWLSGLRGEGKAELGKHSNNVQTMLGAFTLQSNPGWQVCGPVTRPARPGRPITPCPGTPFGGAVRFRGRVEGGGNFAGIRVGEASHPGPNSSTEPNVEPTQCPSCSHSLRFVQKPRHCTACGTQSQRWCQHCSNRQAKLSPGATTWCLPCISGAGGGNSKGINPVPYAPHYHPQLTPQRPFCR